ncbi:MAG: MoaD/ThiS family protein [Candidatus Natronoplasma sp.]
MMNVNIESEGKVEVPQGSRISAVIEKLDHHIDSVIVLCDGEPIPLDHELEENMDLKILPVVSGG